MCNFLVQTLPCTKRLLFLFIQLGTSAVDETCVSVWPLGKVQLFWEGHKNLRNMPYLVNIKTIRQIEQIFIALSEKLNFTSLTPRCKMARFRNLVRLAINTIAPVLEIVKPVWKKWLLKHEKISLKNAYFSMIEEILVLAWLPKRPQNIKSRTNKSPLMQDWVSRLGLWQK